MADTQSDAPGAPGAHAAQSKTYKRELATGMLVFLGAFFLWGVENAQAAEAARYLTLPIFTFAGGAFGLDAWAKQMR